jgi:PBSX family phage portal protein
VPSESDKPEEVEVPDYDIDEGVVTYVSSSAATEEVDPFAEDAEFAKGLSGVTSNRKRSITALAKRYEGKGDAGSKRIEDDIITGYNAFEVVLPPYNLDYLAKLYEKSSPHYAAVNAKVANIVGLGYDFVDSPTTKRKLDEKADDEAFLKKYRKKLAQGRDTMRELIEDLNQEDTFGETLSKVWKDYEATGNGYLEIGRMDGGGIGYIGHVPSTTIRIRRQRDGYVQIIANKAVFFRNFGKDDPNPLTNDPNPNEIIHIKKYAPSSTFYGVPDIIAAMDAVAGNRFSAQFNLDYFENKAVPRHVVILKGATINPKLARNILEFFETGLKGKNHRSLFIPLPGDTAEKKVELKIEPVEAGIQDSSFNNYRKANLGDILMAHRVPISKVGLAEGVSLAVARDADKTFKEQVSRPEQGTMEKKINRIVKEFTDLFVLKLNELTLTDEDTQSKIDERRRKTGTETANEQRARRGLPSIEGGDELVDLNAAAKVAEARNEMQAQGNRERDSVRSAGATDSAGEGRNPKGEGRTAGG